MAADRDLEMEDVTLNLDRDMKGELEEEKEMREEGGGQDPFKKKRVHRVVSKWMLPEKVRRTYLERANCLPPPVFIISISIAELAVFIYYAVWKPQKQWITLDTGILESPFIYSPEKREEAWRFISYMLVHAGVQHILGNLFMQLVLGIPLEMVHKGLRVGLVYLAGVIAGSLASSIFDPLRYLVGASGGVYALMGGYFMNVLVVRTSGMESMDFLLFNDNRKLGIMVSSFISIHRALIFLLGTRILLSSFIFILIS